MKIGKLERVELREVWEHEAKDFSSWLSENLEYLNEAICQNLTLIDTEVKVSKSRFSIDILAENEDGDGVLIENQLEQTDHKHLGQLITYLVNNDEKVAVWISSDPRQEHINTINWLNEVAEQDFYLLKVEAFKIGDSHPAPFFSVICRPSSEAKEIGKHRKSNIETRRAKKLNRDRANMLVVPAQKEGFDKVFIGEDQWHAIRIRENRIPQIKWIAAYQVAPVSAITHVAKVKEIKQYEDTNKYVVIFDGPAQEIKPIPLGDPRRSPQCPVYAQKERLDSAKDLDEVLSYDDLKEAA